MLDPIVAEARAQAADLPELDGPRAEAWASDLLALLAEVDAAAATGSAGSGESAQRLVAELAADGDAGSCAALHAIGSLEPPLISEVEITGPAPDWVNSLGTSVCDGAWVVRARGGVSALFRFVDADGAGHLLSVDLHRSVPVDSPRPGRPSTRPATAAPSPVTPATGAHRGDPVPSASTPGRAPRDTVEQVGEVTVGPVELLEAIEESDAAVELVDRDPAELADRVASAIGATTDPPESMVATGRLLVARLESLLDRSLTPPTAVPVVVTPLEPRDPDDDAYAADVLVRGLGPLADVDPTEIASAADVLRTAADHDEPLAGWLAASVGPVDLDDPDLDVVTAALAATVAPARLEPLAAEIRDAVVALEWADWLGAALGLVRAGSGSDARPDALIDHVNRAPEVTTSIPKQDRERIAWAFSVCTAPWEPLGLTGAAGALTDFGVAIVPRFLARAWTGSSRG